MKKNIFKKISVSVIVLLLIILNIFSDFSIATSDEYISLKSEKIEDTDKIKIIFNVSGLEKGVLGLQGTLNFDHEVLELEDAKINDENWKMTALNKENGKFIAEISDEEFFNEEKFLYEKEGFIEFIFKNLKKSNNCEITVSDLKLVDSSFKTIELEALTIKYKSINIYLISIVIIVIIVILFFVFKNRIIGGKNERV